MRKWFEDRESLLVYTMLISPFVVLVEGCNNSWLTTVYVPPIRRVSKILPIYIHIETPVFAFIFFLYDKRCLYIYIYIEEKINWMADLSCTTPLIYVSEILI